MLIGNKIDLENIRTISKEDGEKFAVDNNMLFLETSALDSTNIQAAFTLIVKEICENYESDDFDDNKKQGRKIKAEKTRKIRLDQDDHQQIRRERKKKKCC